MKYLILATLCLAACAKSDTPTTSTDAALSKDLTSASAPYDTLKTVSPTEQGSTARPVAQAKPTAYAHETTPHRSRPAASSGTYSNAPGASSGSYNAPAASYPATHTARNTNRDAAIGAGAGAILGATTSRDKVKGAVIGGVLGGVLGGVVGNNVDTHKVPNP